MDKFLLVGLGNPGEKYQENRHNIGFKIADALSIKYNAYFETMKYGDITSFKIKGRSIWLLKPSTFMNLSGNAVRYYLLKHNIKFCNLLIFSDDLHLPFGKIRVKGKGADGGHNGHKDIIEKLSTSSYPRLRFGVGSNFKTGEQSKYVLSDWSEQEIIKLNNFIELAVDAISNFCILGLDSTMSKFN